MNWLRSLDWPTLLLAATVLVAAVQVWLTRKQMRAQFEWSRREAALEYSMTRNELVRASRLWLDKEFGGIFYESPRPSQVEIELLMAEKKDLYTNLSTLLSHYELRAIAIEMDIVNEDVARSMFGPTIQESLKWADGFVQHRLTTNETAMST